MTIQELFNYHKNRKSDINEHLDIIKEYADKCDLVVEFGVRNANGSTIALLASNAKAVISIDINKTIGGKELEKQCLKEKRSWIYSQGSSLDVTIFSDMKLIDTFHSYDLLRQELDIHNKTTYKYIILHDTETFGRKGQDNKNRGLMDAVEEFLEDNSNWCLEKHYKNNNGLTILKRIENV